MKKPASRLIPVLWLAAILLGIALATRLALLARPEAFAATAASEWPRVFGYGLIFDTAAAAYFCLPLALYLAVLPNRVARSRVHGWVFLAFFLAAIYALLVVAAAEWVFWDEFAARFNFIAVDYLVYTHEVLGNIWESYPVGQWLALLAIPSVALWWLLRRPLLAALAVPASPSSRLAIALGWIAMAALSFTTLDTAQKSGGASDAVAELSGNGIYEFFAANYNNELSYSRFYASLPDAEAMHTARTLVGGSDAQWVRTGGSDLHREVFNDNPDKRLNVVLVSVESLGAEFLGVFGNPEGLTPNLDALAAESLSFTQVYATGNRTVRGMEALALSLPPTPGQSIVKRPNNQGLFTLGSIFEDRGYDTAFIYGGYGYFDNLNNFFSNNDYRVVDRTALAKEDIHYENIWGVADEDLFTLALREMDRSKREGGERPFFMHILTTSNHRPYTYPEGRIDIPSGTGRGGAVKYSDKAIGDFIRAARTRPWFKDTLFILTADHGASARGTTRIPLLKYRVPVLFYSPAHIAPGTFDRLMSQVDIAPTLLGALEMGYSSKFFGHDVFRTPPEEDRALVGNYQTLGYMKDGQLVTLQPRRKVTVEALPVELGLPTSRGTSAAQLRTEAISLYQSASLVYNGGQQRDEERNTAPPVRPVRASLPAPRQAGPAAAVLRPPPHAAR